nr:non-ribosomal peptide synthase [Ktedonobacteraceae bacterium]
MTALELLHELQIRDIHLTCVDAKLRVNAPKGAVTPEIRTVLVEQKDALLALLSEEAAQAAETDQEGQATDDVPLQ